MGPSGTVSATPWPHLDHTAVAFGHPPFSALTQASGSVTSRRTHTLAAPPSAKAPSKYSFRKYCSAGIGGTAVLSFCRDPCPALRKGRDTHYTILRRTAGSVRIKTSSRHRKGRAPGPCAPLSSACMRPPRKPVCPPRTGPCNPPSQGLRPCTTAARREGPRPQPPRTTSGNPRDVRAARAGRKPSAAAPSA